MSSNCTFLQPNVLAKILHYLFINCNLLLPQYLVIRFYFYFPDHILQFHIIHILKFFKTFWHVRIRTHIFVLLWYPQFFTDLFLNVNIHSTFHLLITVSSGTLSLKIVQQNRENCLWYKSKNVNKCEGTTVCFILCTASHIGSVTLVNLTYI